MAPVTMPIVARSPPVSRPLLASISLRAMKPRTSAAMLETTKRRRRIERF